MVHLYAYSFIYLVENKWQTNTHDIVYNILAMNMVKF
jgi:hypothetical protein